MSNSVRYCLKTDDDDDDEEEDKKEEEEEAGEVAQCKGPGLNPQCCEERQRDRGRQ